MNSTTFQFKKNKLTFFNTNIQSIPKNFDKLKYFLFGLNYVLMRTEAENGETLLIPLTKTRQHNEKYDMVKLQVKQIIYNNSAAVIAQN